MQATKTGSAINISDLRLKFPLLQQEMNGHPIVFLDSAASSQKPLEVIQAIESYYRNTHANVHRGVYDLSQRATDAFELAREQARHFINASSIEEIIFVRGTTEGINLVASSFGHAYLLPGDEVIISGMEHHSNIVPWQIACERVGAILSIIPVTDNGELDLKTFNKLLTARTKLVALVHVSNTLGTINPVKEIIRKAHEKDIPVLIDGAQAAPHLKIDVQDLDADFYALSSHKAYGPTGIGVLYGKKRWLEAMPPYQGGGEMIANVSFEKTTFNELPFKFEAGTPNIAGAVAMGKAFEFIENMGHEEIGLHENSLLKYATQRLLEIEGLRIIGTSNQKASVISFFIDGTHPYDVGTILDQLGIAVRTGHHCTEPLMDRFEIPGTVRASFAMYNNIADVDRLIDGVRKAAKMLK